MPPNLKLTLNIFSIFVAAALIAPTTAIIASWKALPGDTLYPTKRTLEKVALAITAPNYSANSEIQTRLIARRTDEAVSTILKKSSSTGLDELKAQLEAIRRQIATAPTQAAKQQVAQKAVQELQTTKQKLNQTKVTLAQAISTSTTINTTTIHEETIRYIPIPVNQSTYQPPPTPLLPQASPTPQPETVSQNPTEIIDEIEDTEEEIDDVIDIIETTAASDQAPANTSSDSQPGAQFSPQPIPDHGQGQGPQENPGQNQDHGQGQNNNSESDD